MAFRPRTPTFRPQLSVRRVYLTLQPRSEMKEAPDAYLLHVYLPGFTKDRIKITFVDSSRMVRITGERPIEGNRWSRFDQTYPVPKNSEAETLEGKFELGTLILKMPKMFISQVAPKPEMETTQEKSPTPTGPSEKAVAEDKPDKAQETTPPQSTTTEVEAKPEKAQETIPSQPKTTKVEEPTEENKSASLTSPAQKATQEDTSPKITSEPIRDHSPQNGQEEVVQRPTVTAKPQKGQEEFEPKPTPTPTPTKATKILTDELPPKGQEQVEPKPTLTTITKDPAGEKSQEENRLKPGLATIKEPLEEKIVGMSAEDAEKKRISKKEVKEEDEKPSESRKPVKYMEKGNLEGKEIRTGKLSAKEAEPSAPKVPKKEKESSSRTSPNLEGKNGEDMIDLVGNGIRKLAAASSQVVARIAEGKWNEEEKQLVANVGAAVLVIAALGAYVSCRFTS